MHLQMPPLFATLLTIVVPIACSVVPNQVRDTAPTYTRPISALQTAESLVIFNGTKSKSRNWLYFPEAVAGDSQAFSYATFSKTSHSELLLNNDTTFLVINPNDKSDVSRYIYSLTPPAPASGSGVYFVASPMLNGSQLVTPSGTLALLNTTFYSYSTCLLGAGQFQNFTSTADGKLTALPNPSWTSAGLNGPAPSEKLTFALVGSTVSLDALNATAIIGNRQ